MATMSANHYYCCESDIPAALAQTGTAHLLSTTQLPVNTAELPSAGLNEAARRSEEKSPELRIIAANSHQLAVAGKEIAGNHTVPGYF